MRLEARQLEKGYKGREVVRGVSLSVETGEVVGLLGPNGAGKTTVFHMIVGLIQPRRGEVFLDQEDITDLPMYMRARKGISYLPQEPSVFRKLTVEQNLCAILETLNSPPSEREERLHELLRDLGIERLSHRKAYTLSGGERRRVEIARALVISPRFLLLDEPFTGIDPLMVQEIQGIIFRLKERGIGVLITDHNVEETLEITDRTYLIYNGEIVESGTPQALLTSSKARALYLGERVRL